MKRIGVVTTDHNTPAKCKKCLDDARIPVLKTIQEQPDYLSVYVDDADLQGGLEALRKYGFDAAEMPPSPKP